ncbi:MAG: methyltransferase domain-containing protein [Ruminococcaceae bacterium]|nr:methyltransferase domain-containing protein [Oscillospiraceae bacterium]
MLKRKWFLYITEFFSGMAVMAIELGASRLLAPYFSSSQIVWTIIIGAIMIAMALGNIWGGRLADKNPSPDKLYSRIIVVAIWVAAIPLLGKYVIAGISLLLASFVGSNFLIWASLFSCIALFVFPLMLLGTVSPSLVKYSIASLDESGKIVGELNALNTIGSIIGTFAPTFITIPTVGTSWTFLIFAGILLAIAVAYFISEKKHLVKIIVSLLLMIVLTIFGAGSSFAFWAESGTTMTEDESIYNYLQVTESEEEIRLSTNVLFGIQSIARKDGRLTGMYYDYALAAPFMANVTEKEDFRILILGMGTGTYAKQCYEYFDNTHIEGVEIDKKILDLAYSRFGLPKDPRIECIEFDGRAYLRNADKYDVIMVDAYRDITIPFQMSSKEFFQEVKSHLKEDGVMTVNLNMRSDKKNSINDYLCDTIASVFPYVYTADCGGNREVFASTKGDVMTKLSDGAAAYNDAELTYFMEQVESALTAYQGGNLILTDDKAPVELLGMQVIDELIAEELKYYKDLFKGKSLSEIIDMLK